MYLKYTPNLMLLLWLNYSWRLYLYVTVCNTWSYDKYDDVICVAKIKYQGCLMNIEHKFDDISSGVAALPKSNYLAHKICPCVSTLLSCDYTITS